MSFSTCLSARTKGCFACIDGECLLFILLVPSSTGAIPSDHNELEKFAQCLRASCWLLRQVVWLLRVGDVACCIRKRARNISLADLVKIVVVIAVCDLWGKLYTADIRSKKYKPHEWRVHRPLTFMCVSLIF